MSAILVEDKSKKATRFDAPGVNFKAKMIGLEDVTEPRGDKMCQVAMAKLKAAVVAMGEHKQRITVNISLEGIKLIDEKTESVLHSHSVHRISFIARDTNDYRAFGYVYNREDGIHQFCGIKTDKAAEPLVTCLRDLFQTVIELKKEKDKEHAKNENSQISEITTVENKETSKQDAEEPKAPAAADLLGLDTGLATIEQSLSQLGPLDSTASKSQMSSSSSNNWLNSNLFQSPSPQATAMPPAQHPNAVPPYHYFPQPTSPMSSTAFQSYPQQAPRMQTGPFAAYQTPFGAAHPGNSGVVGPQNPWGQTTSSAVSPPGPRGSADVQGQSQSWISFDSSTQLSSIFGEPTPATLLPPQSTANISGVSLEPTKQSVNDPFAAASKFPDPFADLAVISSQSSTYAGKKASKEDFIKEPPKPTLLDLSQQQQPSINLSASTSGDPFASNADPFGIDGFSTA